MWRAERFDDAAAACKREIAINLRHAPSYLYRRGSHGCAGRPDEAESDSLRAWELDPEDPAFLHQLGKLLHRVGKSDEALWMLRQSSAIQPENTESRYLLGRVLISQGFLEEGKSPLD